MKNNRTFLEKLLDGAEVEWKTVKSLCNDNFWLMPATPEFDDNGNIPYITSKNIKGGKIDFQNTKYINEYVYQELSRTRCIIENDILISMIGTIGEAVIVKKEDLYFYGQNMYVLRLNNELVNHKFFLYYFTAPFILNSLLSKKNSSNQGYLKAGQIESLKIPIPPLSVQTEIVKILDALTALTSELTSELILRQKQYEYYREKLLSFDSLKLSDGVVQWIKLINLGELIRGNGLQKKDFTETGVPAIHYGQIYTYYGTFATKTKSFVSPELAKKLKKAKYGDVLIAGTSENFKDVMKPLGWLGSEIAFSGDMFAFRPNKRVNTKYLTYILQTERFYKFKEKYAQGTKVIRVKADNFLNYEIPLPTLEEQHRIVSILDKFETLTNSITEGLPLAIEQSQKRYEYYRELLLNFKQ
ncbi:restriction endonuclease subunit S [Haemophilus influenzae]|uniref:restriction endonuclease subunit S n=1 Tax=Haemophilus influenzae TaxID=727 RepID=UPI000D011F8A|nr:restriction endonuclease subunit S [Haemophilus influenzae]AXP37842.1 restriction endonuclease subunit S [Haemophilus influenzae]AXP66386.1 restriction endonuclease subunit S [Haemophilus influenzae]AYO34456.1 restriction endonuclease subunit S [Haemophilus influenzae]MCK9649756.1 restriction endonuclease subunit S [Haemophilus influenzae]MCK9651312.1 restriction endonuclease subunit S [Haemophilus influenzae]